MFQLIIHCLDPHGGQPHPRDRPVPAAAGPDAPALRALAAQLDAACRQVGFFYIVGHGVPQAALDGYLGLSARFFDQPAEAKAAGDATRSALGRGWVLPGRPGAPPCAEVPVRAY